MAGVLHIIEESTVGTFTSQEIHKCFLDAPLSALGPAFYYDHRPIVLVDRYDMPVGIVKPESLLRGYLAGRDSDLPLKHVACVVVPSIGGLC